VYHFVVHYSIGILYLSCTHILRTFTRMERRNRMWYWYNNRCKPKTIKSSTLRLLSKLKDEMSSGTPKKQCYLVPSLSLAMYLLP